MRSYGVPFKEGGRYFFSHNDGLQNQSVLYTQSALDARPRVLLDPNKLSRDGTVALAGMAVSHDGNFLAYGISDAGSDWEEWKVRDVRTGRDTGDDLKWVKSSGASWLKDGSGFFYSRYDAAGGGGEDDGGKLFPETLFPPPRHAAVGGQFDLPSRRSQGLGLRRRRHGRRALSHHFHLAGH